MVSSSRTRYRIIKIDVHSAKLIPKMEGKFYVGMLVRGGHVLRTKLVQSSSTGLSGNQNFVFFDENATVSFTLFKARKYLPDFLAGKATAQMKSLFRPIEDFCCEEDEESNNSTNPKYDDSDNDDECREDEDAEEQEQPLMENFELKANVGLLILDKRSLAVGSLNVVVTAWEKYELNYLGRAKKSFPISEGKLGVLSTQPAAEETGVSYVGDHVKWRNLGMEYEEFTMEKEIPKLQKGRHHFGCFPR